MSLQVVRNLFLKKMYLSWYTKDPNQQSESSLVEHILNYGNWQDYLLAEKELGIKKIKDIFVSLKNQRRVNLRPQTVNYFENYFQKYA